VSPEYPCPRNIRNICPRNIPEYPVPGISKDFGLRDQIRRSAVSIASNIAEGDERETDKESVRFFYIAKGSLAELRTQLMIALEIGYLDKDEFAKIELDCSEIGKMLGGIIKHRSGNRR
jgi:four helix bundle protein